MENNNQQPSEENKIKKNFDNTMKKLVAIVGGEQNLFPVKKVEKDVVANIVTNLIKEKKENIEKEVKTELVSLLDKYVEFKKAVVTKEKELEQLKDNKMKEFNEAANKLFGKVDQIDEISKSYYEALNNSNG